MLQFLKIENLALMHEAELSFEAGFHAVTGETGAGKSVLLGALGILSGQRVEKSIIRKGADVCQVEAVLHFSGETLLLIDRFLVGAGLPVCEEGALVLKRSIHVNKAPRIMINQALSTVSTLRDLGGFWIDFHGPHEPQKLVDPQFQLEMIDLFGGYKAERDQYQAAYAAWRTAETELSRVRDQEKLDSDEIRFLQKQLAKADQLDLSEEAIEELETSFRRLNSAQEIADAVQALVEGLSGYDGVLSTLSGLLRPCDNLVPLEPEAEALRQRLNSLILETEDLAAEFRNLGGDAYFDESDAQRLQERMELWLTLKRKHGGDREGVLAYREGVRNQLDAQGDMDGRILELEAEVQRLFAQVAAAGDALTAVRGQAAQRLEVEVGAVLKTLGFKKADLRIRLLGRKQWAPSGGDDVQFLFSANPGTDPLPLGSIASSGEMARVMLAFKSVLAHYDATPVLVFDEVDANVGGEIGKAVGARLRGLADGHQVFCITHLPQVAAMGTWHWSVEKEQSESETRIKILPLTEHREKRKIELARMMGDRASATALDHAEDLLLGKSH